MRFEGMAAQLTAIIGLSPRPKHFQKPRRVLEGEVAFNEKTGKWSRADENSPPAAT